MKINLLLLITSMLICTMLSSQATSSIRGQIKDEKGEGIAFANIVLKQNGILVKGGQTDFDGNYEIGPLESGLYELEASYVDFKTTKIERILVKAGAATQYSFKMEVAGVDPKEITVIEYKEPIKTTPTSGQTLTADDFMNRGTMDLVAICSNSPRSTQTDEGRATYSTGTRVESNTSYPNPNAGESLNAQNGEGKVTAQATSSIRGNVKDEKGEGIPFVNIVIKQNGTFVMGGQSDYDGNYEIGPLQEGTYDLEASYVGYKITRIERIVVKAGTATDYNFKMEGSGDSIGGIVITEYSVPIIKPSPYTGQVLIATDCWGSRRTMDLTGVYNGTPLNTPTDEGRNTLVSCARAEVGGKYVILWREKPSIHDFFNEPQSSIESEKKTRLATDRDARVLKSGLPYTDPLEHVATLE